MEMPVDLQESAIADFALREIAAELRDSDEYASNGRTARTLAKDAGMRVMLGAVAAGTVLREHSAPGAATLTVLEGRVTYTSERGSLELGAGSCVAFAGGVAHTVAGVEDAVFLLVITSPPVAPAQ